MRHGSWLAVSAMLILLLALIAEQSVAAREESDIDDQSPPAIPVSVIPCDPSVPEQPIPDDGRWLQICLLDPLAPEDTTVTSVYLKYQIKHPDPNQLEVRLSREEAGITQILWDRGKAIQATEFGKAGDLLTFHRTASKGYWFLWVRDVVPGQDGRWKAASLSVTYAPTGPLPELISGTPGRPTSRRLPAGVVPSQTPDQAPTKSNSQRAAPLSVDSWQDIMLETFEGAFPNAGWTLIDDNPNDGKEYLWDDDDYRPHWGSRAVWSANGGTDGYDPAGNPYYPPNMTSWMIYGPFDLSDAKAAEAIFWLWRQTEASYDPIFFGVSSDAVTFDGWLWDGTASWEEQRLRLTSFLGATSMWVGWSFESDNTIQFEGPWVDDILIRKYVPGQVTAQGSLSYAERNGNSASARFTNAYLYDQDPGGTDDLLATTTTDDINGFFQFPAIINWDDDDTDPDPDNRRLDLYVVWETDYNDSPSARRLVTNIGGQAHNWPSFVNTNIPDGVIDFSSTFPPGYTNLEAMWIFQDLRRAWEYVHNNTNPQADPGSVTARWENGQNCFSLYPGITPCNSFFWPDSPLGGIFIRDDQKWSPDTVIHELGHQYMYTARENFWYSLATWNDFFQCVILGHGIDVSRTELCAWTEGWGDFLPLAANNDPCYDFDIRNGACEGTPDHDYFNLETHSRNDNPQQFPWGDTVEGRVTGALYDLIDSNNEAPWWDSANFGFAPIWNIVRVAPHENRFREFWSSWELSGNNEHHALRSIYQNTIDYDDAPAINLPDQPVIVLRNFTWSHTLDLGEYSSDDESTDTELGWQILGVTDPRCGVSLDSHWVNIAPQLGWLGSCDVTISVSDSIKASTDTFRVNVVPVASRNFLSIVLK